jgi:hypothetical protein
LAVLAVHNHFMLESAKLAKQLAAAHQRGDETARQQAADAHHANLQSRYPDFLQARNQLNDKSFPGWCECTGPGGMPLSVFVIGIARVMAPLGSVL